MIMHSKAFDAATQLGLELDSFTADDLKKIYRDKAKECHPDHHGADKLHDWASLSWANDCLTLWLKEQGKVPHKAHAPEVSLGDCPTCKGTGRVNVGKGFTPLNIRCFVCSGAGAAQ